MTEKNFLNEFRINAHALIEEFFVGKSYLIFSQPRYSHVLKKNFHQMVLFEGKFFYQKMINELRETAFESRICFRVLPIKYKILNISPTFSLKIQKLDRIINDKYSL